MPIKVENVGKTSPAYREFVGSPDKFDLIAAWQFNLLAVLGLREHHFLLDLGCGSLRSGRLLIPYLLPGRYFGIEPERWLIEGVIKNELGEDMVRIKRPVFSDNNDFTLSIFNREFDFILAYSVFSHASQQQIRRCLSEAKRVMTSTSIFVATFIKGEEDYAGSEWVYPECVTYTVEHMISLVEEQGFICKLIDWPSTIQTWMLIVSPENEGNIPQLMDMAKLPDLRNELAFYRDRLSRIEAHPYVRLGLKVNRFMRRIGLRMGCF